MGDGSSVLAPSLILDEVARQLEHCLTVMRSGAGLLPAIVVSRWWSCCLSGCFGLETGGFGLCGGGDHGGAVVLKFVGLGRCVWWGGQ